MYVSTISYEVPYAGDFTANFLRKMAYFRRRRELRAKRKIRAVKWWNEIGSNGLGETSIKNSSEFQSSLVHLFSPCFIGPPEHQKRLKDGQNHPTWKLNEYIKNRNSILIRSFFRFGCSVCRSAHKRICIKLMFFRFSFGCCSNHIIMRQQHNSGREIVRKTISSPPIQTHCVSVCWIISLFISFLTQ